MSVARASLALPTQPPGVPHARPRPRAVRRPGLRRRRPPAAGDRHPPGGGGRADRGRGDPARPGRARIHHRPHVRLPDRGLRLDRAPDQRRPPEGHAQPARRGHHDPGRLRRRAVAGLRACHRRAYPAVVASGPGRAPAWPAVLGRPPRPVHRRPPRRPVRPGAGRPGPVAGLGPGEGDAMARLGAGRVRLSRHAGSHRRGHADPRRLPAAVPAQPVRFRPAARGHTDHHQQARRALGHLPAAADRAGLLPVARRRRTRPDRDPPPGRPVIPGPSDRRSSDPRSRSRLRFSRPSDPAFAFSRPSAVIPGRSPPPPR